MNISPLKPRVGIVPRYSLKKARRAKKLLTAALPHCKILLSICPEGFGVRVRHPISEPIEDVWDDVRIKVEPMYVIRPQR